MQSRFITSALLLLTLMSTLTACNFLERNTLGLFRADSAQAGFRSPEKLAMEPAEQAPLSPVTVQPKAIAATPAAAPGTRVEVIWAIPKDPVEGFVVRYGYSKGELKFEDKVASAALDRYDDPKHGFVYRYVLRNVPTDRSVYVTLSAYNGKDLSAPSPVFEVAPSKK